MVELVETLRWGRAATVGILRVCSGCDRQAGYAGRRRSGRRCLPAHGSPPGKEAEAVLFARRTWDVITIVVTVARS